MPRSPLLRLAGASPLPPAFAVVFALAAAVGACGGDPSDEDAGVDEGAPMCTTWRSDPKGPAAPVGTDEAPEDGATVIAFAPADIPLDEGAFPLEVQTGEMTTSGAVFWTRVAGDITPTLRVWRDADADGDVALAHESETAPADGGSIKVPVDTLAPNTDYHYAFFTKDGDAFTGRSALGRVRTALADGVRQRVRFGATTCVGSEDELTRANLEPYPALSLMAEEELDFVVHLGDVSYNDGAGSLAEYRESWTHTFDQQGYRDLLSSTGMYATWDDHEVGDNWNEPESGVSEARVARARQAFDEFMATTRSPDDAIWGSYQWGDTAEIFVLDERSERKPETLGTPDAEFISPEQMAFLKERLSATPAHFKIVMTSVNITNLPSSGGWDVPFGFNDRWEGYAAQREELLDFILDEDIDNVWFLAGDIHMGFVGRLEPEGHPYARMWEITVGPGASAFNPLALAFESDIAITPEDVFPCNQFIFGHGKTQVATTLELDPEADTIHVTFTNALTGDVMFDETLRQEDE